MSTVRPGSDQSRPQRARFLNVLAAASHSLTLALLALFTFAVVVLAQSAFWPNDSLWMRGLLVALASLAFIRPKDGLLVVAGLAPLGQPIARVLGSELRGAEALVLACLAGVLLRGWWSSRTRRFPSDRIETAALLFGLVAVASCLEQLWFLQIQRNFPGPFLQDLAAYVTRDYLVTFRGFGMIFNTMLLLEGLALLLWARHHARMEPGYAGRLARMFVFGAVATAALTVAFAATSFLSTGLPIARFWSFVAPRRWTIHVGDPNAAASFFAMALFMALGIGLTRKTFKLGWFSAALVIGAALWMTGSRTAVVAVLLVASGLGAQVAYARATARQRAFVLAPLAVALLWLFVFNYFVPFLSAQAAERAANIRLLFLGTTLRMVQSQPLFGVGVGQYSLWSQHFSSPQLLAIYQNENAHNNFAQVAGEMGLVGLVAFLLVLWRTLRHGMRARASDSTVRAGLVALIAFIITWLGGHPLLQPAVAYPFWVLLGIVSGVAVVPNEGTRTRDERTPQTGDSTSVATRLRRFELLGGLVFALLAVSLPVRLWAKASALDWSRIGYGFYDWERTSGGQQVRWTGPRARFFVPADVTRISIPLRADDVAPAKPLDVDILVNDRLADQVHISDGGWRSVNLVLVKRRMLDYHRIDMRVSRTWVPSEEFPDSPDSRVLGIQVGLPVILGPRDPHAAVP